MHLTRALLLSALVLLLCLPACSKKEASQNSAAMATNAIAPGDQVLVVTEDMRNELNQLASKLAASIQEQNTNAFEACFDKNALIDEILLGVTASGKNFEAFKKGMRTGVSRSLSGLVGNWANQEMLFKGIVTTLGKPALRFRFIGEDSEGIAFVDFLTKPTGQGKFSVINVYNQSAGFDMAAQVRQTAIPFLAELDKKFLERWLGKPQLSLADVKQFSAFVSCFSQGDNQACIESFPKLAEPLRNTLSAHMVYAGALQRAGNMDGYRKALKEAAARYKGSGFEFMLVDVHFLEKNYDQALQCLDTFAENIGPDAALLTLKSSILLLKGDIAQAKESHSKALALEPQCIYAHTQGLDVLLAARDFKAARESMIFLEEEAGYQFKGALTDPVWKDFLQSPEASKWR